jgi:hypothetical protein
VCLGWLTSAIQNRQAARSGEAAPLSFRFWGARLEPIEPLRNGRALPPHWTTITSTPARAG